MKLGIESLYFINLHLGGVIDFDRNYSIVFVDGNLMPLTQHNEHLLKYDGYLAKHSGGPPRSTLLHTLNHGDRHFQSIERLLPLAHQ